MPGYRGALAAAVLVAAVCVLPTLAADPGPASKSDVVTLRGRVVCLDALAATVADPAADPCNQEGARFEFRGAQDVVRLLPDDQRALLFLDPAVRARELELRGWRRPGGAFELLSVYSIVGGVPHHLHYRCDVCDITATGPGPCWCCGAPFELREEPVAETAHAERDAG